MDSKIYLGNDLIHPETNSNVVLHNNSNLKNFLNGLVSTDNMPQFMQNFLMSADYIAANQALKTIPEIYFDYAFNKWTATGAPALSGGICSFDGSSRLQSTPGWTICGSNDFTFSCRVKPQFTNSNNPIFSAFNTSNAQPSAQLQFNASYKFNWNYNGGSSAFALESSAVTADQWYFVEFSWDSSDNTRRLFVNGSLVASESRSHVSLKSFRIGGNYAGTTYFMGDIDFIHFSDCVRHSSNFSPKTPTFDDNTLALLLFD